MIIEILALMSAPFALVLGWFFGGKRKANADSVSIEISNLRAVVDEYKELFEQMKSDLKEAKEEYREHLKICLSK